jgi:pyruvate/2-oxoglutarate dehydrogenase complex dihydrolipoamide acyltransferase (E2) component
MSKSMPTQILLPKIGFSMNEGTLAEWLVQDGAEVTEGQPLYALETEKATEEVESPASGVLKIIAQPGTLYQVGDVLGEIG